jgi:farnesyl-diphosphate farnesyltransferase
LEVSISVRSVEGNREALAFARGIISRVSRTFAIGIAVLPGDLGLAVLVGYLLCRIADTIEDDGSATAARRQELLAQFLACFDDPKKRNSFSSCTVRYRKNRARSSRSGPASCRSA